MVMFRAHYVCCLALSLYEGRSPDAGSYFLHILHQKVHHGGEPMPGQEQEEIVVMAGSQTLPNKTCPLSGKPVDQLENPVRR